MALQQWLKCTVCGAPDVRSTISSLRMTADGDTLASIQASARSSYGSLCMLHQGTASTAAEAGYAAWASQPGQQQAGGGLLQHAAIAVQQLPVVSYTTELAEPGPPLPHSSMHTTTGAPSSSEPYDSSTTGQMLQALLRQRMGSIDLPRRPASAMGAANTTTPQGSLTRDHLQQGTPQHYPPRPASAPALPGYEHPSLRPLRSPRPGIGHSTALSQPLSPGRATTPAALSLAEQGPGSPSKQQLRSHLAKIEQQVRQYIEDRSSESDASPRSSTSSMYRHQGTMSGSASVARSSMVQIVSESNTPRQSSAAVGPAASRACQLQACACCPRCGTTSASQLPAVAQQDRGVRGIATAGMEGLPQQQQQQQQQGPAGMQRSRHSSRSVVLEPSLQAQQAALQQQQHQQQQQVVPQQSAVPRSVMLLLSDDEPAGADQQQQEEEEEAVVESPREWADRGMGHHEPQQQRQASALELALDDIIHPQQMREQQQKQQQAVHMHRQQQQEQLRSVCQSQTQQQVQRGSRGGDRQSSVHVAAYDDAAGGARSSGISTRTASALLPPVYDDLDDYHTHSLDSPPPRPASTTGSAMAQRIRSQTFQDLQHYPPRPASAPTLPGYHRPRSGTAGTTGDRPGSPGSSLRHTVHGTQLAYREQAGWAQPQQVPRTGPIARPQQQSAGPQPGPGSATLHTCSGPGSPKAAAARPSAAHRAPSPAAQPGSARGSAPCLGSRQQQQAAASQPERTRHSSSSALAEHGARVQQHLQRHVGGQQQREQQQPCSRPQSSMLPLPEEGPSWEEGGQWDSPRSGHASSAYCSPRDCESDWQKDNEQHAQQEQPRELQEEQEEQEEHVSSQRPGARPSKRHSSADWARFSFNVAASAKEVVGSRGASRASSRASSPCLSHGRSASHAGGDEDLPLAPRQASRSTSPQLPAGLSAGLGGPSMKLAARSASAATGWGQIGQAPLAGLHTAAPAAQEQRRPSTTAWAEAEAEVEEAGSAQPSPRASSSSLPPPQQLLRTSSGRVYSRWQHPEGQQPDEGWSLSAEEVRCMLLPKSLAPQAHSPRSPRAASTWQHALALAASEALLAMSPRSRSRIMLRSHALKDG